MTADIDPDGGRVLELGGGTGVITRAILATGLPADRLEVIEGNPEFVWRLRRQFHGVGILPIMAQDAAAQVSGPPGSYQMIVSGLPLIAMPLAVRRAILAQCFILLAPGGRLVQFTYSPRSPISRDVLDAMGLRAQRVGQVYRNWPPASIFHYTRDKG